MDEELAGRLDLGLVSTILPTRAENGVGQTVPPGRV